MHCNKNKTQTSSKLCVLGKLCCQLLQNNIGYISICLDENREMKGSECWKNLVLAAISMSQQGLDGSPDGSKIYRMIIALIELQKIAYALESERTARTILRAHNQAMIFGLLCMELFKNPKTCSIRAMFGIPMHSITNHLPAELRLVSGRTLVAENAERYFNRLRLEFGQKGFIFEL